MRLSRLLIILTFVFTAGWAFGQNQPEDAPVYAERDLSQSVHIFPNPAIDVEYVHVRLQEIPANRAKVAVHNILGNKMEVESDIVDEHELRVRIKDLASGYYLLAVKDEEGTFRGTFKFLKR